MQITIDGVAPEPPFSQIGSQITAAIGTGELTVGNRLPTIRRLATDLGVAPGTVARAYRELEVRGLLETRGRHGTFVADPEEQRAHHRRQLADLADAYASTTARLGIRPADASDLIDQALRRRGQSAG